MDYGAGTLQVQLKIEMRPSLGIHSELFKCFRRPYAGLRRVKVQLCPNPMVTLPKPPRRTLASPPHTRLTYRARLAAGPDDVRASQVLRFAIFNLELREGLPESFITGRDEDRFDAVCDHLLVEEVEQGKLVGSYRLQTGTEAARHLGYYSEQEFDFRPYEASRAEMIELGRACVHRDHRNLAVLGLLWRGIAAYARERAGRYLIGCSSLTSQDPAHGAFVYALLRPRHLASASWRTRPWPGLQCAEEATPAPFKVPKLLSAYLAIGAKICGPPALDREFRTIDFLTLLDLKSVPARTAARYLS